MRTRKFRLVALTWVGWLLLVAAPVQARLTQLTLGQLACPSGFSVEVNTIADPQINGAEMLDFNGDGRTDVALGSPQFDPIGVTNGGRGCVVFQPTPCQSMLNLAAINNGFGGFCLQGDQANGQMGIRINVAGDINGDGRDDVIFNDLGFRSSIVFGTPVPIAGPLLPSSLNGTNGFTVGRQFTSAFPLGDFNGDGLDDLGLSLINPARLCVLFGRATGWPASIDPGSMFFNGTNGFCMLAPPGGGNWPVTTSSFRMPASASRAPQVTQPAYLMGAAIQGAAGWTFGLMHRFGPPYSTTNYVFGATPSFTTLTYPSENINCISRFGSVATLSEAVGVNIACWAGAGPSLAFHIPDAEALRGVSNLNLLTGVFPAGSIRFEVPPSVDIDYLDSAQNGNLLTITAATSPSGFNAGPTNVFVGLLPPEGLNTAQGGLLNAPQGNDPHLVYLERMALAQLDALFLEFQPTTAGELISIPTFGVTPDGQIPMLLAERDSLAVQFLRLVLDVRKVDPVIGKFGFEALPIQ